jgi:tetratricopeptide (TPR) repeat protein
MGTANLVGWDFAKLETELKVRGLQRVYPGDEPEFIGRVWRFEDDLARETERRNNENFEDWKPARDHDTAERRLLALMLGIRRQAKKCLEVVHGRSRRWLHEYYFLLACYGVYAGRFEAYFRRDLIAAYVCAGYAAGRYAWGQTNLIKPEKAALAEARRALADNHAEARLELRQALHYGPEFVFAREFARSRRPDFIQPAIEMFEDLLGRHPSAVEIRQELALALCELSDLTGDESPRRKSERVLSDLDAYHPHYETLCRWGRLWKDRGDREFDVSGNAGTVPGDKNDAARREGLKSRMSYERALEYYRQAYEIERHYYPGINVATLLRLLGDAAAAERLARTLLDELEKLPRDATPETVWRLATQAEAHLIVGDCDAAAVLYTAALKHSKCQPQNKEAMHKQVRRLLKTCPSCNVDFGDVFGEA